MYELMRWYTEYLHCRYFLQFDAEYDQIVNLKLLS